MCSSRRQDFGWNARTFKLHKEIDFSRIEQGVDLPNVLRRISCHSSLAIIIGMSKLTYCLNLTPRASCPLILTLTLSYRKRSWPGLSTAQMLSLRSSSYDWWNNWSWDTSSLGYFKSGEIPAAQMAFKCAIHKRATILRESGRRTFNHSTGSKSQPCHARGGISRKTTNYCDRYKAKLHQVPYGYKDGGDQTARRVPWNKTLGTIEVAFPAPIVKVTKREILRKMSKIYDLLGLASPVTLLRNIRRPSTLGLWPSQRA